MPRNVYLIPTLLGDGRQNLRVVVTPEDIEIVYEGPAPNAAADEFENLAAAVNRGMDALRAGLEPPTCHRVFVTFFHGAVQGDNSLVKVSTHRTLSCISFGYLLSVTFSYFFYYYYLFIFFQLCPQCYSDGANPVFRLPPAFCNSGMRVHSDFFLRQSGHMQCVSCRRDLFVSLSSSRLLSPTPSTDYYYLFTFVFFFRRPSLRPMWPLPQGMILLLRFLLCES